MLIRSLLSALLLFTASPARAGASAPDAAYQDAKDSYQKLKKDEAKRKLRHNWLNVAKKFEAVATKFPKSDRAADALFMQAELLNELSRFSANGEDVAQAEKSYKRLIDSWPKSKLADDAALSWGHLLADRKQDVSSARKVLTAALPQATDKKKQIAELLAAFPEEKKKKVEPTKPAPKKEEKAHAALVVGKKPEAAQKSNVPSPISEAIAKLARSVKPAVHEDGEGQVPPIVKEGDEPVVQARRSPAIERPKARSIEEAAEPPRDEAPPTDEPEATEEGEQPIVASLAEKLRDVRVGVKDVKVDDSAKARLKATAKAEQGAEISLAQQLGLKVRRVIVDAGHGGHDTGAIGPEGTREKDVSLAIAKKLTKQLEAMGLEVVLTRDDDTFVALEERTRIANREKGDLFISVHCNAAPTKKLRGIETYTLNTSSNRYSIRLSARENATTERGVGDLQYILADLATKANTGESQHLAELVQRGVVSTLAKDYTGVKSLGTKEALFFVLLGAKMPAILVETSFISHPEEEQRLADDEYQAKVANGIAGAVETFLEERNKIAQMD